MKKLSIWLPVLVEVFLCQNAFSQKLTDSLLALESLKASLPLDKFKVNSFFGKRAHPVTGEKNSFHSGLDLKARYSAVYSVLPGIAEVAFNPILGNYVTLSHSRYETIYGHLSMVLVYPGEFVGTGELIAISGNTGRSTGPHLHFSVRHDQHLINPISFLITVVNLQGSELLNYLKN